MPQVGGVLQGAAGAAEEVQLEVFEGQLGVFGEGRGQLAGGGVGFDLAGELDDDARCSGRRPRGRSPAASRRGLVRGGEVDRAGQGVVEQRGVDFDRADLGGVGALRRFGGGAGRAATVVVRTVSPSVRVRLATIETAPAKLWVAVSAGTSVRKGDEEGDGVGGEDMDATVAMRAADDGDVTAADSREGLEGLLNFFGGGGGGE